MKTNRNIEKTEATQGPQARVLIVDDERDGAKALGMLLEMSGYTVDVVTDSTLSFERLESFKPDVILLDIAMPRISGYELAQQIRQRQEFERVVLIAMSGFADHEHARRSIEAGCAQHLVKPAKLAALEAAITQELTNRAAHPLKSTKTISS